MRGKIRAATRFNRFREDMLLKFRDDASISSDFIAYLREPIPINELIRSYCDETETLKYLEAGGPTAIYQVLRLIDKPTLLRNLEVLSEHIWGRAGKNILYSSLSVLYGTNLVDYTYREFNSTPANVIQFFVKEED